MPATVMKSEIYHSFHSTNRNVRRSSGLLRFVAAFKVVITKVLLHSVQLLTETFYLGDAAVGEGVKRHILSSAISKLKKGFNMNIGEFCCLCLSYSNQFCYPC